MRNVPVVLFFVCSGCATEPPNIAHGPPSNVYDVAWSSGHSDSPGVPAPIDCTELISHPCPFRLYTTTLTVNFNTGSIAWGDATGGSNANGVSAADLPPIVDASAYTANGDLSIADGGDDGGLRYTTTLGTIGGGWEGDITWALFNVAGRTTFHATIVPR